MPCKEVLGKTTILFFVYRVSGVKWQGIYHLEFVPYSLRRIKPFTFAKLTIEFPTVYPLESPPLRGR